MTQPTESRGRAARARDEALAKCFHSDEVIIGAAVACLIDELSVRDVARLVELLNDGRGQWLAGDLHDALNAPEEG